MLLEKKRDREEIVGGNVFDDAVLVDIAEQRQFVLAALREREVGTADDHVGLNTDILEFLDRVLSRLGFLLAADPDIRNERDVNVDGVVLAENAAALTNGFEERRTFDIADRAADVDDHYVAFTVERKYAVFDLRGDVRNDLNGRAVVLASSLFRDDVGEHLPRGHVVFLAEVFA